VEEAKAARCRIARSAGLGFENRGVRDPRIISLDADVQTVFEGEFDRVLQAYLKLAIVDELLEPRRIGDDRFIDADLLVGLEEIGKCAGAVGEIVFG